MNGFQIAVKWAGGTNKALAQRLSVTPAAITKWKHQGIPAERALQIERMSEGQIKASDLYRWDAA